MGRVYDNLLQRGHGGNGPVFNLTGQADEFVEKYSLRELGLEPLKDNKRIVSGSQVVTNTTPETLGYRDTLITVQATAFCTWCGF